MPPKITLLSTDGTKGSGVFDIDKRAASDTFGACHEGCEFASGGYAYHVLNRAVGRARIFGKTRDYEAFEEVLAAGEETACRCGFWLGV